MNSPKWYIEEVKKDGVVKGYNVRTDDYDARDHGLISTLDRAIKCCDELNNTPPPPIFEYKKVYPLDETGTQ